MPLPPVSLRCSTYRRVPQLEEILYCFLVQNYDGEKEFLIVNDDPLVKLVFDHPEVRIINYRQKFRNINEKINISVSECKYDIVMPTGDDDIIAIWGLTEGVKAFINSSKEYVRIAPWFKGPGLMERNQHMCGVYLVSRDFWVDRGGRTNRNSDTQFDKEMAGKGFREDVFVKKPYFWWRISGRFDWGKKNYDDEYGIWKKFNGKREEVVLKPGLNHKLYGNKYKHLGYFEKV